MRQSSSKELEKFRNRILNTQRALKLAHDCYCKIGSQLSRKKVIQNRYSKIDSQLLLKNRSTTVTRKVIHKCYAKIGTQLLLKTDLKTAYKTLTCSWLF